MSGTWLKSVFKLSSADLRTAEMLCLRKGQSLGNNSVIFPMLCISLSFIDFFDINDDNNDMTLLVDESRSSRSSRMSHKMLTITGI